MSRIAIIGNAGGGKSTLARALSRKRGLPHVELDRLLWQESWQPASSDVFARRHAELIQRDRWIIDGLGQQASVLERLSRATEVILIDMPLWTHFWLAAERQVAWARGKLEHPPGGIAEMPSTRALFRTIWDVDQGWMPEIRALCIDAEADGKIVARLTNLDELDAFAQSI